VAAVTSPTQIQRAALPSGIELAYETFGDPADPPVVLVMGLATQMIGWPEGLCAELVARGLHVVRFDNRDAGLSTHLHDAPPGDIVAAFNGDTSSAAYTLADLATDTVGLLDHLGFDAVHLVGASMGGMIAQLVAIEHPERVLSLTSIMSNTGDGKGGLPEEAAVGVLMARPATTREEAIEKSVAGWRVIGSPGFEFDEAAVRERAALAFDRGNDPAGTARQLVGVLASPDRTARLESVRVPTLVIHGKADLLVHPSGGEATAAAVPGAELVLIDGMGHDFPRELWPVIAGHIAALAARAQAS
jgi:pimeloyl-ACP methyl ester carboxylesterase